MTKSPLFIIFLSELVYCCLWLISPLDVEYPISGLSLFLYVLGLVSFFVGYALFYAMPRTPRLRVVIDENDSVRALKAVFYFFCLVLFISVCLRFVDKVVLRGFMQYGSAIERRDSGTESTLLGAVSAPFFMLSLLMPVFLYYIKIDVWKKFLVWIAFFLPSLEVMLMGSRGIMITSMTMLFVYTSYLYGINLKKLILFVLGGLLAFSLSAFIFVSRISEYGMNPEDSAMFSNYAYTLVPDSNALALISGDGYFSLLVFSFVNFSQYVLHGLPEFSYLIDNFSRVDLQNGSYTFSIVGKLVSLVAGNSWVVYEAPRFGVYTTFLGPLFVDFSYGAFVFMFFLGWVTAFVYGKVARRNYIYLPAYAYLLTLMLFYPVVNLVQNALGVYVVAALLVYHAVIHIKMVYLVKRSSV